MLSDLTKNMLLKGNSVQEETVQLEDHKHRRGEKNAEERKRLFNSNEKVQKWLRIFEV